MTDRSSSVLSASTIEGDKVVNTDGEMLGHVKDIVLDLEDGRIAYALISTDPAAPEDSRLQIVPWELVRLDSDTGWLVLDVDRDQLESAPSFERGERPDLADPYLQQRIYGHYGYTTGVAA